MSASAEGVARLLVVDDNEMNRDLLSRRLTRQGFAVDTAEDGAQALAQAAAQAYDLVLLDIMMPVLNGYETLERLKADPALSHIPVIMITAVDDSDSVARCIGMGAEDHLPKPFNPVILRARIDAALAKKRLRDQEQLYARSLERELEIGRLIQRSFLPEQLPQVPGWRLAARFQPARQVAGDFYDAFPLPDGRVGLLVADVCDKGVGAALFMALFRSLIRVLALQNCADPAAGAVLARTLTSVNDYIALTHSRANMFATVFFGVLSPDSGELHYIGAGHDAPVLRDADGSIRRLNATGPAVGLMEGLEFRLGHEVLAPGSLLLAFTDGVTDARDPRGETFGEAALLAAIPPPGADAGTALTRVLAAVEAHVAGSEPFDDVTLLVLSRD